MSSHRVASTSPKRTISPSEVLKLPIQPAPPRQQGQKRKRVTFKEGTKPSAPNLQGPKPPPLPEPEYIWVCCSCDRANPGLRTERSTCDRPECRHISWISGTADGRRYSRACGYCGDHVIVRPEVEGVLERNIFAHTREGGWVHGDGECFRYHSTRPRVKDCERCGEERIEGEKVKLTRRIDMEAREPGLEHVED